MKLHLQILPIILYGVVGSDLKFYDSQLICTYFHIFLAWMVDRRIYARTHYFSF